jgi:hypothetical protein
VVVDDDVVAATKGAAAVAILIHDDTIMGAYYWEYYGYDFVADRMMMMMKILCEKASYPRDPFGVCCSSDRYAPYVTVVPITYVGVVVVAALHRRPVVAVLD